MKKVKAKKFFEMIKGLDFEEENTPRNIWRFYYKQEKMTNRWEYVAKCRRDRMNGTIEFWIKEEIEI